MAPFPPSMTVVLAMAIVHVSGFGAFRPDDEAPVDVSIDDLSGRVNTGSGAAGYTGYCPTDGCTSNAGICADSIAVPKTVPFNLRIGVIQDISDATAAICYTQCKSAKGCATFSVKQGSKCALYRSCTQPLLTTGAGFGFTTYKMDDDFPTWYTTPGKQSHSDAMNFCASKNRHGEPDRLCRLDEYCLDGVVEGLYRKTDSKDQFGPNAQWDHSTSASAVSSSQRALDPVGNGKGFYAKSWLGDQKAPYLGEGEFSGKHLWLQIGNSGSVATCDNRKSQTVSATVNSDGTEYDWRKKVLCCSSAGFHTEYGLNKKSLAAGEPIYESIYEGGGYVKDFGARVWSRQVFHSNMRRTAWVRTGNPYTPADLPVREGGGTVLLSNLAVGGLSGQDLWATGTPTVARVGRRLQAQQYEVLDRGVNGCPAGAEITTTSECDTALLAIGMSQWARAMGYTGPDPNTPRYCSRGKRQVSHPLEGRFNTGTTGRGSTFFSPVCKRTSPSSVTVEATRFCSYCIYNWNEPRRSWDADTAQDTSPTWTKVTGGELSFVSASKVSTHMVGLRDFAVGAIQPSTSNHIWYCATGCTTWSNWIVIPIATAGSGANQFLKTISVGGMNGEHIWATTSSGTTLYRHQGAAIPAWEVIPGGLSEVYVTGAYGEHVWGRQAGGTVFYRTGRVGLWNIVHGGVTALSVGGTHGDVVTTSWYGYTLDRNGYAEGAQSSWTVSGYGMEQLLSGSRPIPPPAASGDAVPVRAMQQLMVKLTATKVESGSTEIAWANPVEFTRINEATGATAAATAASVGGSSAARSTAALTAPVNKCTPQGCTWPWEHEFELNFDDDCESPFGFPKLSAAPCTMLKAIFGTHTLNEDLRELTKGFLPNIGKTIAQSPFAAPGTTCVWNPEKKPCSGLPLELADLPAMPARTFFPTGAAGDQMHKALGVLYSGSKTFLGKVSTRGMRRKAMCGYWDLWYQYIRKTLPEPTCAYTSALVGDGKCEGDFGSTDYGKCEGKLKLRLGTLKITAAISATRAGVVSATGGVELVFTENFKAAVASATGSPFPTNKFKMADIPFKVPIGTAFGPVAALVSKAAGLNVEGTISAGATSSDKYMGAGAKLELRLPSIETLVPKEILDFMKTIKLDQALLNNIGKQFYTGYQAGTITDATSLLKYFENKICLGMAMPTPKELFDMFKETDKLKIKQGLMKKTKLGSCKAETGVTKMSITKFIQDATLSSSPAPPDIIDTSKGCMKTYNENGLCSTLNKCSTLTAASCP